jgi:glycosyltransferase involved in cell wall biosynthesis
MKKVIILRNEILPLSETFISEQMRYLEDWHPILVGRKLCENGLNLAGLEYRIIPKIRESILQKLSTRTKSMLGIENKGITDYIRSLEPDLVHVHFGIDAVSYWDSIKHLNIPILVTLHGYDITISKEWWQQGKGGYFMKKYPERLISLSKHTNVRFIAVSEAIKQKAIEFGIAEDKVQVHYIGVDTNKFKSSGLPLSQRDNVVLFVGRFVEKKAPLQLIQAFSQVVKHVPDAKLVMVGDGILKKEAESLAKKLNLPVEFRGALRHEQVLEEYDKAKVFCLPSIAANNGDAEGLPISILEAISKNLFAVITSHSGNKEIPNLEKIGLTINENNVEQIACSLIELLRRDTKVDIQNIEDFIRKFDLYECTQNLENIYTEVTK